MTNNRDQEIVDGKRLLNICDRGTYRSGGGWNSFSVKNAPVWYAVGSSVMSSAVLDAQRAGVTRLWLAHTAAVLPI